MKKLLFAFVLLVSVAFADRDPWEDFDNNGKGNGHGHGHPVVPEPSTYGAIFLATATSFVAFNRYRKR